MPYGAPLTFGLGKDVVFMQNPCKISSFLRQLKVELFQNGSSHPASQIKTDLPPATQILCWLLLALQKHKHNKLMSSV